jgi:ureidoglycolate lyase
VSRIIRVEPLTKEAFAPFGAIIAPPPRDPDIETPFNRYWDGVAPFRVQGAPQIAFLRVFWRSLVVPSLERHFTHTQAFIPLCGHPLVFVLAPPSEGGPELDRARAFLLDGSAGVVLHEGTWHHLLFPLVPEAHVLLLLEEGTKEHDMHVEQLPESIEVHL